MRHTRNATARGSRRGIFVWGRAARRPVQDAGILPHAGRRGFSVMRGFAGCSCRMFPGAAGCSCCMPPGGLQDASAACLSEGVCGNFAVCSWKPQSAPVSCPQERVVERPCRMPLRGVRRMFSPRAPGGRRMPLLHTPGVRAAPRPTRRIVRADAFATPWFPWVPAEGGGCAQEAYADEQPPVLEKSAPSGRKIAVMPQIGLRLVRPMLADLVKRMRRIAHEAKRAHFRGDFVAYREKNGLRRVGLSETAASGTE